MNNSITTFFGPRLKSIHGKETIGGGTILFENLISEIEEIHDVININGDSDSLIMKSLYNLKLIFIYIFKSADTRVLFVAHRQAILFLFIDFLMRRKSIYRLIGGNFDYWFKSKFVKFLLRNNSKITKVLCELPKDVEFFSSLRIEANIQENFRNKLNFQFLKTHSTYEGLVFGFMGRVCIEKGIMEFINLAMLCPSHKFIIAGPFQSKEQEKEILDRIYEIDNISYLGVLHHSKVDNFFNEIDVFFFHSNHIGEGKPGVLVESLIRKIPIITNYEVECDNWKLFYKKKNIIITKDYLNTLSVTNFQEIGFDEKDLEIFSAKFCVEQISCLNKH